MVWQNGILLWTQLFEASLRYKTWMLWPTFKSWDSPSSCYTHTSTHTHLHVYAIIDVYVCVLSLSTLVLGNHEYLESSCSSNWWTKTPCNRVISSHTDIHYQHNSHLLPKFKIMKLTPFFQIFLSLTVHCHAVQHLKFTLYFLVCYCIPLLF